jgi:hypothetical protein
MNQPGSRYRNQDRFSRPEPQMPELQPPLAGLNLAALAVPVVSGAGGWLEKIIPNKLERR